GAQRAMVVHFGEADVLKGQVTQARDGLVGRKLAGADLLKEPLDLVGSHESRVSRFTFPVSSFELQLASANGRPPARKGKSITQRTRRESSRKHFFLRHAGAADGDEVRGPRGAGLVQRAAIKAAQEALAHASGDIGAVELA